MKIDDKYKWLARDKDGNLCAFKKRPIKGENYWSVEVMGDGFRYIAKKEDVYPFIKWKDEEPCHIQEANQIVGSEEFNLLNTVDNVNKPTHYHSGNIDVIKFSEENFSKEEQKGFHRINAIKYITRYDRKNGVEDLNKAKFYIDKLIEMEESE